MSEPWYGIELVELGEAHAAPLGTIEGTEEMVAFQSHPPFTQATAEDYVKRYLASRDEFPRKWWEFAIIADAQMVGRIGASIETARADIWYVVGREFQGRGLATEAARKMIGFLRGLGVESVWIECDPENFPSCRLAQRLGFRLHQTQDQCIVIKGELRGSSEYVLNLT